MIQTESFTEAMRHFESRLRELEERVKSLEERDRELASLFMIIASALRDLAEAIKSLAELRKLVPIVRELSERMRRLEDRVGRLETAVERLRAYVSAGFMTLGAAVGANFEEFVRSFTTRYLQEVGVLRRGQKLEKRVVEGEEFDLYCEAPLVLGEVKTTLVDLTDFERFVERGEEGREEAR